LCGVKRPAHNFVGAFILQIFRPIRKIHLRFPAQFGLRKGWPKLLGDFSEGTGWPHGIRRMGFSGKRDQFDRLMSASLPAALRFAVRLTGNLDAAEDVVQEAMLAASRSWKTFRGEAQFRTWLLRIVVNTFRNRLAKPAEAKRLEIDLVDPGQCSPSDSAAAAELSDHVARCIGHLPLRQREVIVLSAYEGLDAAQIAEVLEMNMANVYSTLNVARTKLRECLEPYFAGK
jgi:RNA polymerase sigma-70 factor (ECF subfamily)